MIAHRVTTQPTTEPVTVDEVRDFMGISQAGDVSRDAVLESRIKTARIWCESYTRRAFITQTLTGYAHQFPDWELMLTPKLVSVSSVKYLDNNGTDTTLAGSEYLVDLVGNSITPAYNKQWPTARCQANSVRIEYISGAATVDEPIKEAIKFIVGQWETFQRSFEGAGYPPDFPNVAKSLLAPYVDQRQRF